MVRRSCSCWRAKAAIAAWLDRRYNLGGTIDKDWGVLPLNGSREGLSFGAISARDQLAKDVARPAVILPNPFYQTYAAAAHIAGAEAVMLDTGADTGFLPDLDALEPELLPRHPVAEPRPARRSAPRSG